MNLCRSCGEDFGSEAAFSAHRVGDHAYTLTEGLKQDPPVENGRRCLSTRELANTTHRNGTLVFAVNARSAWSLTRDLDHARKLNKEVGDGV